MQFIDKIFIAGHNGMVGSAIKKELERQGYCNILTANKNELDLCNELQVEDFFQTHKPNFVFLAAAKVGGIQANINEPFNFLFDNLKIQNNVIYSSFKNDVKKLCFIGSSCIYPKNASQPIKEEYLLNGPLEPTNEGYALAKITGIKLGQYLSKQFGFNVINPMPCNLYGPNDSFHPVNSHVLSSLVRKFSDAIHNNDDCVNVWGTGIAKREFMHVEDLSRAIIFLMNNYNKPDIINVGLGTDISIKELAEKIANLTGFKGSINWDKTKPDGMLKKCLDITKIKELGFSSAITLDEGITQMINIYKKQIEKI